MLKLKWILECFAPRCLNSELHTTLKCKDYQTMAPLFTMSLVSTLKGEAKRKKEKRKKENLRENNSHGT
jgi:hypothetical protein